MPALPAGTDARLLSALPADDARPVAERPHAWTLAEPGRDYLAVASPGEPVRVDLSADLVRPSRSIGSTRDRPGDRAVAGPSWAARSVRSRPRPPARPCSG